MTPPERFAVATFGRVYDMTPQPDALTLDELASALTRFQLKTQLARRIDRDLEKFRRGEGPWVEKLRKFTAEEVEHQIRREAKTDFRIWTPALFRPGARRESEGLLHVSALVFDLDDRPSLDAVRQGFRHWWHVGHSTWSHTPEKPKFRVCIPFAQPIVPEDFLSVWDFGDEAIGGGADRTGRNVARGMALPAVAHRDSPRVAWVHIAPLFDPVADGIARASPHATPAPTGLSFMRLDPTETYLNADVSTDAEDEDPWSGGATIPRSAAMVSVKSLSAAPAQPHTTPAPSATVPRAPPPHAPDLDAILSRLAAVEARLRVLELRLGDDQR